MTEPQTTRMGGSNWIPRLVTDPAFMALVTTRWKQLRQGVLAGATEGHRATGRLPTVQTAAADEDATLPLEEKFNDRP